LIGTRGVRLGVIKPGLYAMQVRALMEAAVERVLAQGQAKGRDHDSVDRHQGGDGLGPRLAEDAIAQTMATVKKKLDVTIGTMIETPRAAIRADEIAEEAEFFSFGTNDLTQLTFGFSRDDVEGRLMSTYLELGLLKRQPVRDHRQARRRRPGADGRRTGTGDQARDQVGRVRRDGEQ